uniref:Orf298 n=1 Tax=Mutarda arvensis TaxID=2982281 RepID=A0A1D6WKH9_MUTAR|nr:orf298 [Sinapis arvensis]AJR33070.1 orf298 [Sinapis arvensis]
MIVLIIILIMKKVKWLFLTISPCDAAELWQLGSQDAATPIMQGIIDLHHDIFFFLILILVFVLWILVRALWHFHYKENAIPQRIVHGTTIEILRTIFPSLISIFITIPSFALSMDAPLIEAMLPSPNRSSSEDSFGLRVLCEPWPIIPNLGLESSILNRIRILEDSNSPFLLGKEKGEYWAEIKQSLRNSSSQREYYRGLDFENRDLLIREHKHSCYKIFREVLLSNPSLEEAAAYYPQESFIAFLNEKRDDPDFCHPGHSPAEVDRLEILFLNQVEKDIVRHGSESIHIKRVLGNLD